MTESNVSEALPPRLYIPGATAAQAAEIQATALMPEGTMEFSFGDDALYEQEGAFRLIEIPTGATLVRISRDAERNLHFLHASPGTGAREALIALPARQVGGQFLIFVTWSSAGTTLYAGFVGTPPITAEGVLTNERIQVIGDRIFTLGGHGLEFAGVQIFEGGQLLARDNAIEAWATTNVAIDVHMRSATTDGHLGRTIQANLAIVMLATAVETYCGRRFRELPAEGRSVNVQRVATGFLPAGRRSGFEPRTLEDVLSVVQIDFGNYEACRKAYSTGFGIRFGNDLGLPASVLRDLKRALAYRHRIVHVSPTIGLLNQADVPPEDPVFSNAELVQVLRGALGAFIGALHAATLRLE